MATSTLDTRLIPTVQYAAPETGATVTVNNTGHVRLILNPAGSLLALTVTLPGSPSDGDMIELGCSQVVTTLTMNGGTIVGGLTSFAVGGFASYAYSSTGASWFRIG